MDPVAKYIILAVAAYLVGSASVASLVARRAGGIDIRTVGSGNPGSTNVLRSMGLKWGMLTFLLDIIKGALPTLIGLLWAGYVGAYIAGAGAILGHAFSLYLRCRGGKSVATTCGVLAVLYPWMTLAVAVVAILIMVLTRIVSLGSILGFVLYTVLAFVFPGAYPGLCWFVLGVSALIIFLHRANIGRLLKGKENRITLKKKA